MALFNIEIIKNALTSVGVPVSRYFAVKKTDQYIVWSEDSQADSQWCDNHMKSQAIQGTIDYFTKIENDSNVDKIQEALNKKSVSFYLNSVQYETDTKFIHYEWVWSIWQK